MEAGYFLQCANDKFTWGSPWVIKILEIELHEKYTAIKYSLPKPG